MIRLSPERTKTLLAIHGWSAVFLGLLLYVVLVTGTTSVLAPEIADWSSPLETRPSAELPPGLDAALRDLAGQVDPEYHEELTVFARAGGRLSTFFHKHEVHPSSGEVEEIGVEFDLHPRSFAVLDRREGWEEDIASRNQGSALADFLAALHVRLHVPDPYGLLLTGILGLMMMVSAVTGFVVHRHLLRDLFTLRGRKGSALGKRDAHVVAGSWILPFAFLVAFTGSYFSFSEILGFPTMAQVAFEGDEDALFVKLSGIPPAEDARPAPTADVDAMIADAGARAGAAPSFLLIEHWGRADARVSLFTELKDGDLINPSYVYSGVDGELRYAKPDFGLAPSTASVLVGVIAPLHFGNFAGWLSKAVWLALGFAAVYVSLTGLLLWCERRREVRAWQRLARLGHWVGYGLPLALAATPYGYFPARAAGIVETDGAMTAAFLAAAALAAVLAWVLRELSTLKRVLLGLTGILLVGLPLLRLLSGGPGWAAVWGEDMDAVLILDILMVLGGVLCILAVRRRSVVAAPAAHTGPITVGSEPE